MLRRYWGKNWRSNQENYSNIYRLKMHVGTNGSFQTLFRENLEFSKKMATFPSNNSRDIGRVLFLEVWNPSGIDSNLYWRAQPHETLWFNWMDQKVGKIRLVDQKNRFQIGQCRHQRMKNCLWGVTLAYSNIYLILPPLYFAEVPNSRWGITILSIYLKNGTETIKTYATVTINLILKVKVTEKSVRTETEMRLSKLF